MRSPYTQLFLHCVWATWDRLPLITVDVERQVYASIVSKSHELKCDVYAIGGIEDHIHLLLRLPSNIAVATLVGEVKGASSHLMTHTVKPGVFFKWQGAYGAFTLDKGGVPRVADYIKHQKSHHAEQRLIADWETWETG